MLALGLGQHQPAGDAVEHVGRRRAAAALLQPGVPGRADVGALRDLLAAQARRAPAAREAEGGRVEPRAAIPEIGAEQIVGWSMTDMANPVNDLYHDKSHYL